MTQRIVRLFLALAVAFAFAGRMEAAAQHCARLWHADSSYVKDAAVTTEAAIHVGAASCHGEGAAGHETSPPPAHQETLSDSCECIAVLKACAAPVEATASARMEPYEWTAAVAVSFASVEPAPDFRPPRA